MSVKRAFAAWPEVLTDCVRLLSQLDDRVAGDKRPSERHVCPEVAFRITLCRSADGGTDLEGIVGGIPEIVACMVHPVAPRLSASWQPPGQNEQPIGVVMRRARREDLYLFYRACDASLVLYTLPETSQSTVMVVPLGDDGVIRQATLGGEVYRIEFSALPPGCYLVASFPKVNLDALFREALRLRKQDMHSEALTLIEEVLEFDPEYFEAWTRKGTSLRAMGRRDEAMVAVEEALRLNPKYALAWRAKGALLRDTDRHQEGLDCYLRSLELDPTDYICWENKGNALLALERKAEADEAYAEAKRVEKLYPEAKY